MNPATEQRFRHRTKQAAINLQYLSSGLQSLLEKPELEQPEVAEFVANTIQYVDTERQVITELEGELQQERLVHFYRVLGICGVTLFLGWQVIANLPRQSPQPQPPRVIRMQPLPKSP